VTAIALASSADDPALAKGQRKLSVTWKLSLKGGQIDGRLRSTLDTATAAADSAERAAFALDMNSAADKAEVAKAKADAASAKAAKLDAETKYRTGLSSERGRLAKLFLCGEARLATNRAVRAASNAKAASDACKTLEKIDDVEVTLTYMLDRYELPVGLVYSLGKAQVMSQVASETLLKLDPR
jgi:flagellar motor switch/type III secretory pathway protein FliN